MDKKIIFGILLLCLLLVSASFIVPLLVDPESQSVAVNETQFLPWHIETTANGNSKVFGLTLGETTLQTAETHFHGGAEVSLFVSPEGQYTSEAYFDKVVLGGFSSQMVLSMELSQAELAAMFQRGSRVSNLGNGRKKVTLSAEDLQKVFRSPVISLAYLSRARLDDELLIKRFGEPQQRLQETESDITHWLYPDLGLDVALNSNGRAVLQYVPPRRFTDLVEPLLRLEKNKQGDR